MTPRKLTLLFASTLTVMSGATISPALPLIEDTFAATPDVEFLSRLVLTVPALFITLCSPVAGWLVDRLGRLRLLVVGLVLYAVGGVAGGLVDGLYAMLASRAALGVAVGLVMTTVATLIADYYRGDERTALLGQQAAAMSLGGIVFILAGGALASLSWRAPFFIYAAALLLLPLLARYLEEPAPTDNSGDDAASVAARAPVPWAQILPLCATMLVAMIVFYLTPVQLPFLLAGFGVSPTLVGVAVAGTTVSGAVASFNYARVKGALGPWWVLSLAFGLLGLGYALVPLAGSYALVAGTVLISGFGVGFIMPNVNQLVMQAAPAAQRGRVLGLLSSSLFLGQFLSPIAVAPLVEGVGLAETFGYVGYATVGLAAVWAAVALTRKRSGGTPNEAMA